MSEPNTTSKKDASQAPSVGTFGPDRSTENGFVAHLRRRDPVALVFDAIVLLVISQGITYVLGIVSVRLAGEPIESPYAGSSSRGAEGVLADLLYVGAGVFAALFYVALIVAALAIARLIAGAIERSG